jgi:hypothetical protein
MPGVLLMWQCLNYPRDRDLDSDLKFASLPLMASAHWQPEAPVPVGSGCPERLRLQVALKFKLILENLKQDRDPGPGLQEHHMCQ